MVAVADQVVVVAAGVASALTNGVAGNLRAAQLPAREAFVFVLVWRTRLRAAHRTGSSCVPAGGT